MDRILLTGASSGIGAALAAELLARGHRVALLSRNEVALSAVARAADPGGGRSLVRAVDVADCGDLERAVEDAARTFGGLDVAVANAGIGIPGPAASPAPEDLRRVFDLNVVGAVMTLAFAFPHVRRSAAGLLAGVSSMAAWRGGPGAGAYNASKAALSRYLESLRAEVHPTGVRVLEVNPGFVRTPMTDRNDFRMPFLLEPAAAARTIARAIERRASHCAFPRRALCVMGLLRHLPDRAFDALARRLARKLAAD